MGAIQANGRGYTPGMKTAVSIPNDVFLAADRLAKRTGRSRSAVYASALREYLRRYDPKALAAAMERMNARIAEPAQQAWLRASAETMLRNTEW